MLHAVACLSFCSLCEMTETYFYLERIVEKCVCEISCTPPNPPENELEKTEIKEQDEQAKSLNITSIYLFKKKMNT